VNPLHKHIGPADCPEAASGLRNSRPAGRKASKSAHLPARWPAGLLVLLAWCLAGEAFAQTGTPLVSLTNSVWRFNDTATDLGTAWKASSYPAENQWPSGQGLFGVESTDPYPYPEPVHTALVLNAGRTTYYFRTPFNFAGNPAGLTLQVTAYVDDGAVFYLNGAELHRVRLPDGPIAFTNKAELAFPEGVPVVFNFPATRLAAGSNVLAVEVHQHSDTSSDVVFGLSLEVLETQAPVILDPAEPADRAVPEGEATTLSVAVSAFPVPAYQWFKDGAEIPGATASTLALANMSEEQAGNYFCRVTNSSGAITSRTAAVTFLADTSPLAILYALAQENPTDVLVTFSEPPDSEEARDNFSWQVEEVGVGTQLTVLEGTMLDSSTLLLTTEQPRDPNRSYLLRRIENLREAVDRGNMMPAGTEAPIASFVTTLIPNDETHLWRYDQSGVDLNSNWVSPGYDDSGWRTGAGVFDAFRSDVTLPPCRDTLPGITSPDDVVRTCITLSNAANTGLIPTIYFRTHFTFAGDAAHSILRLETIVNDGAVFYLNGAELARVRLPDGTITYNTPAYSSAGLDAVTQLDLDAPSLIAGENVLAVELHQGNLEDPFVNRDSTFALKLFGVLPSQPAPRLMVRQAGGNLTVSWTPASGILESADDPSGPWSAVLEAHPPGEYVTPAGETKKFYRVSVP
jgi:hypothetical protein